MSPALALDGVLFVSICCCCCRRRDGLSVGQSDGWLVCSSVHRREARSRLWRERTACRPDPSRTGLPGLLGRQQPTQAKLCGRSSLAPLAPGP